MTNLNKEKLSNFFEKATKATVYVFAVMLVVFVCAIGMANAGTFTEDFDDYSLGNIAGQGSWSTSGTVTATVNDDVYVSLDNSLFVDTATNVSNDWAQYLLATSTPYTFYFYIKHDVGAGNVSCFSLLNASSTTHTFACVEVDGSLYINGQDTSQNISDNILTRIGIEVDEAGNRARTNIDGGSWSTYKVLGITDNFTTKIRLSAIGAGAYFEDITTESATAGNPVGDIEIIELESEDYTVQVGGETFNFPPRVECLISTTTCEIKINYSYENIGSIAYLLLDSVDQLENATDIITALEDKPVLKDYFQAATSSVEKIDTYNIFVWNPDTNEGKLFGPIKVYWVEEASDDVGVLGNFFLIFKRIFPLSLWYDIYDTMIEAGETRQESNRLRVEMSDFLVYSSNATGTLFSSDLITENLPVYETKIYPFLELLGHLTVFFFLVILLLKLKPKQE